MRVSLFSTAILFLTLIAASSSAMACDCMTPPEAERFKRSDAVFEGEVIAVLPHPQYPKLPVGYVFRVSKTLKGTPETEITITKTSSNCEAVFSPGSVYRVYAASIDGKLRSGQCSGNKLLSRKRNKPKANRLKPSLL